MRNLALLLALGVSLTARAEVENPNLIPFGEEEAFLGNAGIAHNESTGATYYNPGALGFIRNKKVSIYANAYSAEHLYIRANTRLLGNDVPLNSSAFTPVPLSSVSIWGNEKFTYAFSVHVPYSETFQFQMPLAAPNVNLALLGTIQASSLWVGPSVGKRVSKNFGWGASVYAIRYAENGIILDNVSATSGAQSAVGTAGFSQELKAWGALAVLGAQWQLAHDWRFGARLQTQTVDLYGKGNYYSVSSGTNTGVPTNTYINESGFDARYRLPWQLGFGLESSSVRGAELLADVNAQFPIDYQTSPTRPSFSNHVLTRFRPRANLGAKVRLDGTHSLLSGFLYNPSTLPSFASPLTAFTDLDFKGATLGLQYDGGVLSSTAGGFFLWATGTAPISGATPATYTTVEQQFYGVLMTASYKLQ
jgi:hypothetical protein